MDELDSVVNAVVSSDNEIQKSATAFIVELCRHHPESGFPFFVRKILPLLPSTKESYRLGAIKVADGSSFTNATIDYCVGIVSSLDAEVIPYIIFLVVPILGRRMEILILPAKASPVSAI